MSRKVYLKGTVQFSFEGTQEEAEELNLDMVEGEFHSVNDVTTESINIIDTPEEGVYVIDAEVSVILLLDEGVIPKDIAQSPNNWNTNEGKISFNSIELEVEYSK